MIQSPKNLTEQLLNLCERIAVEMRALFNTVDTKLGKTEKAASAKTADTATASVTATKATQDASGNIITSTYATKTEVTQGLAGKANASHTHTTAQVTGLDTALAGKANASHTHTSASITDLSTTLAPYATTAVMNTELAKKAPMSHTHTKSQITDFPEIPDTSTLIPKTGDRGALRGYETATLLEGSVINNDSPDVMYGGSSIVVENGLDSTSWTKVLYDQLDYAVGDEPAAPSSITLGNKWGWAGGTVPTLGGGIVVLHWNKNAGVASFISAKK